MKHMTLEEWDRHVAPYLAVIEMRARHIKVDAEAIADWVRLIPFAPDFETTAFDRLAEAREVLAQADAVLQEALAAYQAKEKVK